MALDFNSLLVRAYSIARNSPDPSTQNAAIIVRKDGGLIGSGCNTFPYGLVVTEEMLQRPLKYTYIEHSERNAVYDAARLGNSTYDTIMVCPWASCADCARAIVQSGIKCLVRHADASDRSPARWHDSLKAADTILLGGGVQIIDVRGHLGAPSIMHCEELWNP